MSAAQACLEAVQVQGFRPWLRYPEPDDPDQPTRGAPSLSIDGDKPLSEELRESVKAHRNALKAAVLLVDPPAWLARLFDLYWSGDETPVKLTWPKNASTQERLDFGDGGPEEPSEALPYPQNLRGGKTEVFMVSLSIKNICAAVAAEIGAPVLEWERLRPEVEEALGSWKGAS